MDPWIKEGPAYLERWINEQRIDRESVARIIEGINISARGEVPADDPRSRASIFIPGLEEAPWWDNDRFPWVSALEAAVDDIRAEFVCAGGVDGVRTVQETSGRTDAGRWSAVYLYYMGQSYAKNIKQCPRTLDVLASIPGATECGLCYFSILDPHTHVVAHTGFTNAHLRCHLALDVPPGCRMRVGNEKREWVRGKTLIFDDSYEHEVWNDSDRPRAVLLFDTWHPGLTGPERRALTHMQEIWRKLYRRHSLMDDLLRAT